MLEFDATLVAALAFFAFIGILLYLKLPSTIAKGLDEQSAAIAKELAQARQLRVEAEKLRQSYVDQQNHAQAQANALIAQAKADAKTLKAQAKIQLEADIAAKTKAATEAIKRAEQVAIAEVRAHTAETAIAIAERMIIAGADGKSADALLARSFKTIETKLAN
ncbi:MAG: F-type H+-transporting ATPase subunit b [Hyphomonadaceae bacterium]|nr:MAG: F-type H+-transporting ATPase subunit b [Hyphomonadaceae bacterium]KAF0185503.1 MAG: F-type H+-transporting ATPase subunit b [Hyphomonadaceae bacterium]